MTLPSSILSLFFFFSVTATLLIPTRSDVSFNTLLFKGKSHSHRGLTAVKHVHKGSNRRLLSECRHYKSCLVATSSQGSNDSAVYTRIVAPTTTPTVSYSNSGNLTVCSKNATRRCNTSISSTPFASPVKPNSSSPPPTTILLPPPPPPSPRRSRPISPAPAPELTFSPFSYAPDKHQLWRTKVIIGAASAVIGVFCFIFCCFRYKSLIRRVKLCFTTKSDPNIEAFLTNHGAVAQKRYKFSEVKKMTNSFKVKLGQGGFGAVYEGKLPTGCPVAVKLLNASKRNGEEFINEVASISRTSHVNIVTLLGFCLEGRKKALIYEFMANGSLDNFIYKKGPATIASLSWENLYQISIGIARGLEYLHRGCNTKILHFDIKPHNILLDENFCPKISDFGLAKLCPRKESIISMSDTRGTMGYVAPEMINRHFGGVSHKSDVYSYGMMLLEMVGGRKNINAEASHPSDIYFPHLVYRRLELDGDVRPDEVMNTEENEIAKRMTVVGLWCIQTFPNDRPPMSRVVDMLEDNKNSLDMPPKPLYSSPSRSETESSS